MSQIMKKVTLWRAISAVIFAAGLWATYLRFFAGWRAATNLSDGQPWGIWVGVATLCGAATLPAKNLQSVLYFLYLEITSSGAEQFG